MKLGTLVIDLKRKILDSISALESVTVVGPNEIKITFPAVSKTLRSNKARIKVSEMALRIATKWSDASLRLNFDDGSTLSVSNHSYYTGNRFDRSMKLVKNPTWTVKE